jgi:phenylpropionate dioxygenase-like ring-hydroxylating dioxygenase large terminal subunit
MFIRNCWYVAAFGDEVSNRPLGRRILGEDLVLFRQSNGAVAALEDRCSHRGLPLSLGELNGDLIRCNYHGLEYDCSGKCVFIPGQKAIPSAARVKSYPICERGRAIWIWMGNPEKADESAIPAFPWFDDPGWAWKGKPFPIKCNYEMLNDNLLDLSHLAYVHRRTLGGEPETHFNAQMETTRTERTVKVVRRMPDCEPPPTYSRMVELKGRVDRWQEIEFFPGLITLYSGGVDAGTGAYEGRREGGFQLRLFDAVTPESETTTLNLFCCGHNFRVNEPEATNLLFAEFENVLGEDIRVLEAQQARLGDSSGHSFVNIVADAPGILARRLLAEMGARENPS